MGEEEAGRRRLRERAGRRAVAQLRARDENKDGRSTRTHKLEALLLEALDDLGDETTLDACKGNQKWRSGRREGRGRSPFLAHKYITGKSFPPQPPYINQMTVVPTPKRFSG